MTLSQDAFAPMHREFSIPVLKTERLVLRAPRPGDAEAIARLANDRRVAANTARIPHPYGLDEAKQFIAAVNRRGGDAAFLIALDGVPIGICGANSREDEPELGYWLGVPYWGQGYATEAARAVIDYAFGTLQYAALHAGVRVNNPASRRVLEKCGFQWTGVRLIRVRAINSAAPADCFRLDCRLWESLRSWGPVSRVA